MNILKKVSSSVRRSMLILVGTGVIFSLAFAIPNMTTLAAGAAVVEPPTPTVQPSRPENTPTPKKGDGGAALSKAFKNEQSLFATQQTNLDKAGGSVSKIQDLISKVSAKGIDTSALSSALAIFQEQLATANASHATAGGILSAANGFDANGNVTAMAAARQTVQDARQNLMDCHTTLVQALKDLHSAVKTWEDSTRDVFQNTHLQKDYQNEQNWLGIQATNLGKTDNVVTKVQDLISAASAKGLDTSALSSALATFQGEIATAYSSHATAEGILSSHNGFDGSGNVTDQTSAQQTVKDAHQSLLDAHNVLVQSLKDIQTAIQNWKAANEANTPGTSVNNG